MADKEAGLTARASHGETQKETTPFDPSQWIGLGKSWVEGRMPPSVEEARNHSRRIPLDVIATYIPSTSLNVSSLLADFPPVSSATPYTIAYSTDTPNLFSGTSTSDYHLPEALTHLCQQHYPRNVLHIFRESYNNAWLGGSQSIILSSHPNIRFPLWAEKLLSLREQSFFKRDMWAVSTRWLQDLSHHPHHIVREFARKSYQRASALPFDELLPNQLEHAILRSVDLTRLLGTTWLDDEVINAASSWVTQQATQHAEAPKVIVLSTHFYGHLERRLSDLEHPFEERRRTATEHRIINNDVDIVALPTNISNLHWTLVEINLRSKTIFFRDSISTTTSIPPDYLLLLIGWLAILRPGELFSVESRTLPRQSDTHSCGVVVISELAHVILGCSQWSVDTAVMERLVWFNRLSEVVAVEEDSDEADVPNSSSSAPPLASSPSLSSSSDLPMDISTISDTNFSEDHFLGHLMPINSRSSSVSLDGEPLSEPPLITPPFDPLFAASVDILAVFDEGGDSDSDSDEDVEHTPRKRRRLESGQGSKQGQKAWDRQKERVKLAKAGVLPSTSGSAARFLEKVLKIDAHAQVSPNGLEVRCSWCAIWSTLRAPYEMLRFNQHRNRVSCVKARKKGNIAPSLSVFGFTPAKPAPSQPTPNPLISVPCPGLLRTQHPKVDQYMTRSASSGGGARSRLTLALLLFDRPWVELTGKESAVVLRRVAQEYKWINQHALGAVFATDCQKVVKQLRSEASVVDTSTCPSCLALLHLRAFQTAANKPIPPENLMKHVPILFRSEKLGEIYAKHRGVRDLIEGHAHGSPWARFAQGALNGTYAQYETFLGLVKAMVTKTDRLAKGKSLRNMKYDSSFDQVCSIIALVAPRAYKTFRYHLGGRSLRSMQQHRAKAPKFEHGISAQNVEVVAQILSKLKYRGPVALSCDDSKLEKALHAYRVDETTWKIIGQAGDPVVVPEDLVEKVMGNMSGRLADKLRLWVLSIPVPKVPPIVIAVMARGSNGVDAPELAAFTNDLLDLLTARGIFPISNAHDGAQLERTTQEELVVALPTRKYIVSGDATVGCPPITISIPQRNGRPFVQIQDSPHSVKTARNQVFTGARFLTLGNQPLHYALLRQIADNKEGPLFRRDVYGVDRQDDRAALRTLSSATLRHLKEHQPDDVALAVYLFITGEMADAWQNREIPYVDRARMVFRARHFFQAWAAHVDSHPDYARHTHFISRESFDIFISGICDGLISLIIAYRDFYPDYPFLPWLHSTACCEHIFGIIRKLKADFSIGDLMQLLPKLTVLLQAEFGDLSAQEQANKVGAGYHHTYYKTEGVNLKEMRHWPSDAELAEASRLGMQDAAGLLAALGLDAAALLCPSKRTATPTIPPVPNKAIHPEPTDELVAHPDDKVPPPSFREIIKAREALPLETIEVEDQRDTLVAGIIAAEADILNSIDKLDEPNDKTWSGIKKSLEHGLHAPDAVISVRVASSAASSRVPTAIVQEDGSVDISVLVEIRNAHETPAAKRAARQVGRALAQVLSRKPAPSIPSPDEADHPEESPETKQKLSARLLDLIGVHLTGATAGSARAIRYTGTVTGLTTQARERNKILGDNATAEEFNVQRLDYFRPLANIHATVLNGNVSVLLPELNLYSGSFVVVYHKGRVLLGEVITLYRLSGKRHEHIDVATSIGGTSYISVRAYRPLMDGSADMPPPPTSLPFPTISNPLPTTFTSACHPPQNLPTFLHIAATHVLYSMAGHRIQKTVIGQSRNGLRMLSLPMGAAFIFQQWVSRTNDVDVAVSEFAAFRKKKGKKKKAVVEETGDAGEESDGDAEMPE